MNLHSPKPNYRNEIKISGWFYIHTAILENSVKIRPPRKFVISQDIYNKSSATNHLSYRTATIQRQHFPSLFSLFQNTLLKRPYHGHISTENTKFSENRRCHCFSENNSNARDLPTLNFQVNIKIYASRQQGCHWQWGQQSLQRLQHLDNFFDKKQQAS